MRLIYLKRSGGKTTKAIKHARQTGAVLVVKNHYYVMLLVSEFKASNGKRGLPEAQVITFSEFLRGADRLRGIRYRTGFGLPEYIIDNADLLLQEMAPSFGFITHVTMSKPFTKMECKKLGIPSGGSRT